MKTNHLTLKIFLLIVFNDILDTIAQLAMKKGLVDSQGLLWFGIIIYILNFFVWIVVLYRVDLSIAMPVGSTSYIFVPIAAIIFLHETVSPLRWLGILCIVAGIHFVSQSKKPARARAGGGDG